MPEDSGTERSLGRIEGALSGLDKKFGEFSAYVDREFKEQNEARRRVYERMDRHEQRVAAILEESEKKARVSAQREEELRQHMTTELDPLVDRTEAHGGAIGQLEKDLADHETVHKLETREKATHKRWVKVMAAIIIALAGDHVLGDSVKKWISGFIENKH